MIYQPDQSEEFRIALPEHYFGANIQQLLSQYKDSTYEIFVMAAKDQSFNYGYGDDMNQAFDGYNTLQRGIIGLVPHTFKTVTTTLTNGLMQPDIGKTSTTL